MGDPLDRVLSRLKAVKKVGGRQFIARCPAHDDRRPSLSVKEGDDGRVLMYCHAGCHVSDIVRAMNLEMVDLFDTSRSTRGRGRGQ